MQLFVAASLLLLCASIPSSIALPFADERRNSPSQCSASYIQSAESHANKSLKQTISTLCSSLQGKYKTVTHTVYTTTVHPQNTVEATNTAPRPVKTATVTAEATKQTTDVEPSTTVVTITDTSTETSVVATDTVTVLPSGGLRRRNQYPCQQIESLLSLPVSSATPFCSCYETGTTSTTTVTHTAASTASAVHITDRTTITPSASTTFATIYQTTTQVTTEESEVDVTSTVQADVTVSATDTVTVTATPGPLTSGYLQVQDTSSPFDSFYVRFDYDPDGAPLILTPDGDEADSLELRNSNLFSNRNQVAVQHPSCGQLGCNTLFMVDPGELPYNGQDESETICEIAPITNELSCSGGGYDDTRNVLQICESTPGDFGYNETISYVSLDPAPVEGCSLASFVLVASTD